MSTLSPFERWMVKSNIEESIPESGREWTLATLHANGYHRVADAVAAATAEPLSAVPVLPFPSRYPECFRVDVHYEDGSFTRTTFEHFYVAWAQYSVMCYMTRDSDRTVTLTLGPEFRAIPFAWRSR